MPLVGLKNEDGTIEKRFEEIDLSDIGWLYPADDPALIAFLIEQANDRKDVDPSAVSASQLETGVRQLFLQDTTDYYTTPTREIAAVMGTIKHNLINTNRPEFLTELRLTGPNGESAKCDTYHIPTRRLTDLKTVKWYKVKMMLEQGVMESAPGYVYQLNLFRILMKDPENRYRMRMHAAQAGYPGILQDTDFDVAEMRLTCIPGDMNASNQKEARKYVTHDPTIFQITVPFLDDAVVLSAYSVKRTTKVDAAETGYAPLCTPEERWESYGVPKKCLFYCPVANACRAMSYRNNEDHPIDLYRERAPRKATKRAA